MTVTVGDRTGHGALIILPSISVKVPHSVPCEQVWCLTRQQKGKDVGRQLSVCPMEALVQRAPVVLRCVGH